MNWLFDTEDSPCKTRECSSHKPICVIPFAFAELFGRMRTALSREGAVHDTFTLNSNVSPFTIVGRESVCTEIPISTGLAVESGTVSGKAFNVSFSIEKENKKCCSPEKS